MRGKFKFEILEIDLPISLDWFGKAEDEGRTEQPSEKRKREKREEGQVAKSPELASAFILLGETLLLLVLSQYFIKQVLGFSAMLWKDFGTPFSLSFVFSNFTLVFWKILSFVLILAIVIGVVVNLAQVGFLFAPKALAPKMSRISFTWTKVKEKLFLSRQVLVKLLLTLTRTAVLGFFFWILLQVYMPKIVLLSTYSLTESLKIIFEILLSMFLLASILLIVTGILDFFEKKKEYKESLLITKSEAKRELMEEEGNPLIKGRLREMYRVVLVRENIEKQVPKAHVVITNPTHFAVAMQYEMNRMEAPIVVAKGEDMLALRIRQIAQQEGIEIIENPPLARELFRLVEVGDVIPDHLRVVIAEIFVQLYQEGKWDYQDIAG